MTRFLRKPHPFIFNIWSAALPGLVTVLVISLMAPFGIGLNDMTDRLVAACVIGGVVSFCIALTVILVQRLLPAWTASDHWTVGREMLLFLIVLIAISVLITLILPLVLEDFKSNFSYLSVLSRTLAIGILPMFVLILAEQYQHQHAQLKKAKKMEEQLRQGVQKSMLKSVQLYGENEKLELRVNPQDVFFMRSEGNYVDVYYQKEGQMERAVIRNRLKLLHAMIGTTSFVQCHRSYVVNLQHVQRVTGNARNLELHLTNLEASIPVSRNKVQEVTAVIESL